MAYQVLLHRNALKKLMNTPENVREKFRELIEELIILVIKFGKRENVYE